MGRNFMKFKNADKPLKVEVKNNILTISIGVDTLVFAVEHGDYDFLKINDDNEQVNKYKITNAPGFAKEVALELVQEEEDGTTPVHLLLDAACLKAIENGSQYYEENS